MTLENKANKKNEEYTALGLDYPFYVEREADKEFFEYLKDGRLCYVFNARKMGKSSLERRVREKLAKENFKCVLIDLTGIGINANSESWYCSLIHNLAKDFELEINNDDRFNVWWEKRKNKTQIDKFKDFIEVLLNTISQNILIAFDEIDIFLDAPLESETKFSQRDKNDFFSFIRWCYNNRTNDQQYQRLVFCLIGVITPSDLISEPNRTPFNIGHAIELNGFTFEEARKLIEKLQENNIKNPDQVLNDILGWTNGQPFLTQKLCDLVITQQYENFNINNLVEKKIITNWETNDNPKYFTRIQEEIVDRDKHRDEKNLGRRLKLYQSILEIPENQGINPDNSREQEQLCLSGIVIKKDGNLRVANKIFEKIFDLNWVQKKLARLRVYEKELAINWNSTKDQSLLLTGQNLQEAIAWKAKMGTTLEDVDANFIDASQIAEQVDEVISKGKAEINLKEAILSMSQKLVNKTTNQENITNGILEFTNRDLSLIKIICELIDTESIIPEGTEQKWVRKWIKNNIINNWENTPLKQKLSDIRDRLLDSERYLWRLQTYRKILQEEVTDRNDEIDENDLNALLVSGLIIKDNNKLQVANKIYEGIFNEQWIKDYLPPYAQSFIAWRDNNKDNTYLLQDNDLDIALNWLQDKGHLDELEIEFIITSLVWEIWSSPNSDLQELKKQAVKIIQNWRSPLKKKTNNPDTLIKEILKSTKFQPLLLEELCREVEQKYSKGLSSKQQITPFIQTIQKSHAINFLAWLNKEDFKNDFNSLKKTLSNDAQKIFELINSWLNDQQSLKDYLTEKFFNEVSNRILIELNEKFKTDNLTFINELKLLTYDTINLEVKQEPQLDLIFAQEKKRMAQKQFQKKFDELLNNIVDQSQGDLEAIIIFELDEGLPQYHNRKLKETNPNLYNLLFVEVEGEDLGSDAVANFNNLNKFQDTIKNFGNKTSFGDQKYTMVSFEKRKMVLFFDKLDNILIAICFIVSEGTGLASIISRTSQAMPKVKTILEEF